MSWTYSGDPSSSTLDWLRFTIGDTNEKQPVMQNEELEYLIEEYSESTNKLLYETFSRVATKFARDIRRTLGPQTEDPSGRLAFFKSKADYYKKQLANASGLSAGKYAYPKIFKKGMQSNPPWRREGDYYYGGD